MIGLVIFLVFCVIGLGVWNYKLRKKIKQVDDKLTKFLSVDTQIIKKIFPGVVKVTEKHLGIMLGAVSTQVEELMQDVKKEIEAIFGSIFEGKPKEAEQQEVAEGDHDST